MFVACMIAVPIVILALVWLGLRIADNARMWWARKAPGMPRARVLRKAHADQRADLSRARARDRHKRNPPRLTDSIAPQ